MEIQKAAENRPERTTADVLSQLLANVRHAKADYQRFEVEGDPSGYGKLNIMAWLGERTLTTEVAVADAQAKLATLDAAKAAIRQEIAECEGPLTEAKLTLEWYPVDSPALEVLWVTGARRDGLQRALDLLEGK